MQYVCAECQNTYQLSPLRYKCDCGSPLNLEFTTSKQFEYDTSINSLWRYKRNLPIPTNSDVVTLGEGMTPLVELTPTDNPHHFVKLDYLCPTGSYKDRGASILLTHLKSLGVTEVVEDSSGNAGAAIAAYSARADIKCTIFCPESTSKSKLKQISAYGAELKLVPGNRMATTEAVKQATETIPYASHNWHPFFLQGMKTLAYEIYEQMYERMPKHIICPVGFGSIYLGLYIGFRELYQMGKIQSVPQLLGVQPTVCSPIYDAYSNSSTTISRMTQTDTTLAEGITSELPIRTQMLLEAIDYTNGAFTTVDDNQIVAGMKILAEKGLYVEPTSAVVIKAYDKFKNEGIINEEDVTVSILTGSGLKSS
ncbi:threonine synthase [Candidatus Poribacteria bacterium]|nr:MAG: threonine synthase [Candidatus Poribacteria bacterium]